MVINTSTNITQICDDICKILYMVCALFVSLRLQHQFFIRLIVWWKNSRLASSFGSFWLQDMNSLKIQQLWRSVSPIILKALLTHTLLNK